MRFSTSFALSILSVVSLVTADLSPDDSAWRATWEDQFRGPAGSSPNSSTWEIQQGGRTNNNELEVYTSSSRNVQISGGGTVQFVPWRDGSGGWTSGKMQTRFTFQPAAGRTTMVKGVLRMGNNPPGNKAGLWPAFWMLGQSMRQNVGWPQCGELDIMEQRNGEMVGHGTAHCGPACPEPIGRSGAVSIPSNDFQTWSLQWDLRSNSWQTETISWYLNGQRYFSISGRDVGDQGAWNVLAHQPMFILLNLAVGGNFPGNPNSATMDGYGSMLEVQSVGTYVA